MTTQTMTLTPEPKYIQAYEGDDMISYIIKEGFTLSMDVGDQIRSMVNVRDTAIITTNYYVYRARPHYGIGFCIERLLAL
jgi:hypothetical protein